MQNGGPAAIRTYKERSPPTDIIQKLQTASRPPSGGRGNEKIPARLSGVGVMRMRFPRETLPVVFLRRGVSSLNQLSKLVSHKGAGCFYFVEEAHHCRPRQ